MDTTVVPVPPDDLACSVDALRTGAVGGQGIVEGGVSAAAIEEAVGAAGAPVNPDDLARGVNADRAGAADIGRGIVEGGVSAAAIEKAVGAAGVAIRPRDLARAVDAVCLGVAGAGQGIVEGGVGIDWHDTGSFVIVSLAGSIDRKAEPELHFLGPELRPASSTR
jgi:acyl-coenzyme A thioesterase PaaI-like protein